ncbi:holliday junction resolvase [Cetacean poxvirus 1]|nr:holliday junction resolvase [Cetacean poxvirus 1]
MSKIQLSNHEVICAFDIGAKNPARCILEINDNIIKIVDITKLDWSSNWEKQIARDVSAYKCSTVLLERQPKKSPYLKFVYFIKGYLYNTCNVFCVAPVMTGNSYKERKRKSINIFLGWMNLFGFIDNIPLRRKLDDVADSFNMAMRFVLDSHFINHPYKTRKYIK